MPFFDRDSSDNFILKNSVALRDIPASAKSLLIARKNMYVRVTGKFSVPTNDYGPYMGVLSLIDVGGYGSDSDEHGERAGSAAPRELDLSSLPVIP